MGLTCFIFRFLRRPQYGNHDQLGRDIKVVSFNLKKTLKL